MTQTMAPSEGETGGAIARLVKAGENLADAESDLERLRSARHTNVVELGRLKAALIKVKADGQGPLVEALLSGDDRPTISAVLLTEEMQERTAANRLIERQLEAAQRRVSTLGDSLERARGHVLQVTAIPAKVAEVRESIRTLSDQLNFLRGVEVYGDLPRAASDLIDHLRTFNPRGPFFAGIEFDNTTIRQEGVAWAKSIVEQVHDQ